MNDSKIRFIEGELGRPMVKCDECVYDECIDRAGKRRFLGVNCLTHRPKKWFTVGIKLNHGALT